MHEAAADLRVELERGDVAPLGAVVPLRPRAHAQEGSGGGGAGLNHHHHDQDRLADLAAFQALVGPIEVACGCPLYEPPRSECFEAFRARPDGVVRIAQEVSAAVSAGWCRDPLALFVSKVRKRHYEQDPPKAETPAQRELRRPPAARPLDDCARCGERRAIQDVARYLCAECLAA